MKRLYKSGAERIRPGVYKLRRELELIGRNKEREFRVIRCKLGAGFFEWSRPLGNGSFKVMRHRNRNKKRA